MGQLIECGGICIDCGVDQFENMVAFYTATFGAEVVHHEKRWASLRDPRHTVFAAGLAGATSGTNKDDAP